METINLKIPKIPNDPNPIDIPLKNGDQLFIVGPNGSGKSALIQRFVSQLPSDRVKRITAHRQTWLKSGSIDLTPAGRQRYETDRQSYDTALAARWRDDKAGQDLSAVLFDLVSKENARARTIAFHVDKQNIEKAQIISDESPSPFDKINKLLDFGMLEVTIKNDNDQNLIARHPKGQPFNIAEMSDGERNAAIIAAHVITAEPGKVFLIDEPERHLHRSIIQPFLSALFDLRRDCIFIVSTHEITLPVANSNARALMLRSCQWSNNQCVAWNAEVLAPNSQLPEDLKLAILGSRDRILFVEGDPTGSLDFPLYTALFPDLSVVPKGSCEEVQKAVLGLRGSQDKHHVEAFGLIDEDGRKCKEIEKLAEKGVFALEVYSAEALYYCSDAIAAVAYRQAESLGEDESRFIESAKQEAIEILNGHAERMAARRCERKIHQLLLQQAPNWKSIKDNPVQQICVSVDSPYLEELNIFNEFAKNGELDQLVARYPVRESSAFAAIAKALKCQHKNDYERMVIAQIRSDNELAEKLKKRIGPLSATLIR